MLKIRPKFTIAFTVIELMVVVAIIGILVGITVPTYRINNMKSRIASGIPILDSAINTAIEGTETTYSGAFPNPLLLYGNSMAIASYGLISNSPLVKGIWYNTVTAAKSVHMCLYFTAYIGVPGYVAPLDNASGAGTGTANRICMNAIPVNGVYKKTCGIWGAGEPMDIPTQYLPTGCTCNWLANASTGGACNH